MARKWSVGIRDRSKNINGVIVRMKKILLALSLVMFANVSSAALMTTDAHKIGWIHVNGTLQEIELTNDTLGAWGGTGSCSGTTKIYWTPPNLTGEGNAFSDQLLQTVFWAKQNDKKLQVNGACQGDGRLFVYRIYAVDP